MDFPALACPMDGTTLIPEGKSAYCERRHCFDFDRHGTLNLLPVQFKKSKEPGDSKEMVEARKRFLDRGFYQPIATRMQQIAEEYIADIEDEAHDFAFLDAGCGEGYYTVELATSLYGLDDPRRYAVMGMDISKEAIIASAKRDRELTWVVGTNAHLPILDESVDIVFSLFGFPVWREFKRVLKQGGLVVEVTSGEDHLIELRRVLYGEIKEASPKIAAPQGFAMVSQEHVRTNIDGMNEGYLDDLLVMTPHGYRATEARREQALETDFPELTLDAVFSVYRVA